MKGETVQCFVTARIQRGSAAASDNRHVHNVHNLPCRDGGPAGRYPGRADGNKLLRGARRW